MSNEDMNAKLGNFQLACHELALAGQDQFNAVAGRAALEAREGAPYPSDREAKLKEIAARVELKEHVAEITTKATERMQAAKAALESALAALPS